MKRIALFSFLFLASCINSDYKYEDTNFDFKVTKIKRPPYMRLTIVDVNTGSVIQKTQKRCSSWRNLEEGKTYRIKVRHEIQYKDGEVVDDKLLIPSACKIARQARSIV